MIDPDMIPPDVVEAAGKAFLEADSVPACSFNDALHAAIAAALSAWPGAHLVGDMGVYLPLHTENPNAES